MKTFKFAKLDSILTPGYSVLNTGTKDINWFKKV